MWRMFFVSAVVVCLAGVFAVQRIGAQALLKVNEAETQAVLQANRLETRLALENSSQGFTGKVKLEIIDAEDKILAASETNQVIKRGRQALPLALDFMQPQTSSPDNLLWYRLRYSILQENSSLFLSGIVSLSEIMPELFELQISAPENVFAGMRFRAHVAALHPVTKKPVKNVNVTGVVTLDLDTEEDEDELKISAKGRTNDEGFASLNFAIPPNAKLDDDGEISIEGEKNGIKRESEEDLDVSAAARVYLNLDKPIYQPNQKLFARGLYLNPLRLPLAEKELEFEILDEEGETVYEKTVKTSRFGIASLEWQIPANLKLGKYRIEVENGGGDEIGESEFKVTRYDLPNFSVSAKADRTFYLPEQKLAEITVSADYLFGKPVAAGKVRIVQEEAERNWDSESQKRETGEKKVYEGATDREGKFVARVNLTEAHEDLLENEWKRFEDLHFAAYFTDSTTNRTELKRFDVRVSKEPIHIYFIRYSFEPNPKLPYQFYVSTFYADGSPARCEIEVTGNYAQETQGEKIIALGGRTNSYGAAKFEIRIPEKPSASAENRFDLRISARDRQGNAGTFQENFYPDETEKQIFIKTDKTIYLPNENIQAKIGATEENEIVLVDVIKDSSVIYSKRVRLGSDGRAALQIPFRPDFKGELSIAAYFKSANQDRPIVHTKNVIYPSASDLKLNIKASKNVYRPNEEAKISFQAQRASGVLSAGAETALGIVILDKAIEERARTEQTPDNYRDLRSLLGTADAFGSLTRRDLNNLDLNKPLDADLQLAAEFLLVNKTYEPRFWETDSYRENFREIYKDYFAGRLQPFENAVKMHYEKNGDYPHDAVSLKQILSLNGINFDEMRDAWAMPYIAEFGTDRSYVKLTLKTAGADKKIGTEDDFVVREMRFEWFAKTHDALTTILNNYTQQNKKAPQTIDELKAIWKQAGADVDALRDAWNRAPYLTTAKYTRTMAKNILENIGKFDGENQQISRSGSITQEVLLFKLCSTGANGLLETEGVAGSGSDDFDLGAFTVVLSEKPLFEEQALGKISRLKTNNSSGAIGGTILDPSGAVVPGITVKAVNQSSAQIFSGKANADGEYLIANLPSGRYSVTAEAESGFRATTIENVMVSAMNLIKLDIYLSVAAVSAEVTVADQSSATIDATDTKIATRTKVDEKSISGRLNQSGSANQSSTPRVRQYFPETLLWQPELITDKNGRAELSFKFADSLTTWKLYAIASTESGEINLTEKELQTFQPFFAELDPPKILTEGDEIALPVPVRNYTDKKQKVSVSMAENNWSNLLNGSAIRQIEIAPNSSENAVFSFRAAAPVQNGKQKVTALAAKGEGDAIEKNVTVKPNGKEIVQLQSQTFPGTAAFEVKFPADAFPHMRRAELKIYPNLLAHVAESIEGLLKRPHGCGEQTTSSTYPNLLILKIEKDLGRAASEKTKAQAQIYLREGYERLLNYQTPAGGFSFWGKTDAPNVALTAYVLRFLLDAGDFIEVDEKVVRDARNWLFSQQQPDGSFQPRSANVDSTTAYVARSLSLNARQPDAETKKALGAALEFLKKRLPEIKDAYALSNFALAAIAFDDPETAKAIAEKLNSLSQADKEQLFWTTEGTPFYGWGIAGRIETTALAAQVFMRLNENNKFAENISRGLAFLLKNKDRYGVWHSTQTTVNVLDALILLQKSAEDMKKQNNDGEKAEIFVNGRKVKDFNVDINAVSYPLLIDVSPFLSEPANRVEIKNSARAVFIQTQIVATHYVPWKAASAPDEKSPHFDFKVSFDKTEAKIGDEITAAVNIAGKTNRYGMILAEIGIPPGADIDRNSLENAKNVDESISRYDVLPDRVIVYFQANSDTNGFKFKFRPRYALNARSSPSIVYDYYNEEAKSIIAPVRFVVK